MSDKLREERRKNAEELLEKSKEKAEQMLLEKLNHSQNGEIYLDDNDMQTIINAAKEEAQGQPDKVKNPIVAGRNFDMQI